MEKDIKREALRQYFKYFKIWFIIAGILAVITIGAAVVHALTPKPVRGNSQEPTERVYDYADMLTEEEEQSLREYIAECEEKIQADIVIVTIAESVEYDLQDPDDDGDIYERLTMNRLSGSAEETVIRMLTMECLREEFLQLSKKDQEILGRCFGVYGHPKSDLREIAVRNRMKESGVEKAKNQAIQRLRDRCLDSLGWKLRRARRMVERADPRIENIIEFHLVEENL